jgi:hypothetical protein
MPLFKISSVRTAVVVVLQTHAIRIVCPSLTQQDAVVVVPESMHSG